MKFIKFVYRTLEQQLQSSEEKYKKDVKSLQGQLEQVEEKLKGTMHSIIKAFNSWLQWRPFIARFIIANIL